MAPVETTDAATVGPALLLQTLGRMETQSFKLKIVCHRAHGSS